MQMQRLLAAISPHHNAATSDEADYRGWPEELGGEWYPKERGKYSTDFMQQLQQDRPDTPLWLDPEDAANAAAADKVPTEKFALMPQWVGCSWTWRGKAGYWDPKITGNVAQQVCIMLNVVVLGGLELQTNPVILDSASKRTYHCMHHAL
jgi:hypothetical protein